MTTRFSLFVERWRECTACPLCEGRQKVVLARGQIPADVLFIGEAPGESEDCIGIPFCGPAGQLLDRIIDRAIPKKYVDDATDPHGAMAEVLEGAPLQYRIAFTNLVCCIPRDEDGGKATEPGDESIQACSIRLIEFVEIANPRLIVCVGKLAKEWLDPGWKHSIKLERRVPMIDIVHPAAIIRANLAQQNLLVQRAVVVLRNAVEKL